MNTRGVPAEVNTAIERAVAPLLPPWGTTGPTQFLTFRDTGVTPVPHQLGARPDGFLLLGSTGPVYSARLGDWNDEVAYLDANAGTVASVVFVRLREVP